MRRDLMFDVRAANDSDIVKLIERGITAHRIVLLYLPDRPPPLTQTAANDRAAPQATNTPPAPKPPPGLTQTPQQKADAEVAAMGRIARVEAALLASAKYMGPELAKTFTALFTAENLAILAGFLVAGALANTNPVTGAIFDGAMLAFVYYQAGRAGIHALSLMVSATIDAIGATSAAALDKAGADYARAFVGLGGAVFMAWLARRMIREKGGGAQPKEPAPPEPPPRSNAQSGQPTRRPAAEKPIEWPPNDGFDGPPVAKQLDVGTRIDRYGLEGGKFVSPEGTPAGMRSLAPGTLEKPYNIYEVTKPIVVEAGKAAPWFGEVGGGTQYLLPMKVGDAVAQGLLKRVGP